MDTDEIVQKYKFARHAHSKVLSTLLSDHVQSTVKILARNKQTAVLEILLRADKVIKAPNIILSIDGYRNLIQSIIESTTEINHFLETEIFARQTVRCEVCKGRGETGCFICHDSGVCDMCHGTGEFKIAIGKDMDRIGIQNCPACKGSRNCTACRGTGRLQCGGCGGTGFVLE